jgi:hypothetical protein
VCDGLVVYHCYIHISYMCRQNCIKSKLVPI